MIEVKKIHPEGMSESKFLEYIHRDKILHIFTFYDLKYERKKTHVWIAYEDNKIAGYILEYNQIVVHTHGEVRSIARLLDCIKLNECIFIVEPSHFETVKKIFDPVGPSNSQSKGELTKYMVMHVNFETFKPLVRHPVKNLGYEDLKYIPEEIKDKQRKEIEKSTKNGVAFGTYDNGVWVSLAVVPELDIVEDLALIRGVYTMLSHRTQGLATSVCSVLVAELLSLEKEAVLWVAEDNNPARRLYENLGFKKKHDLLGFKAKRI